MNTFAPAAELPALEKLREEELEEARALQCVMTWPQLFSTARSEAGGKTGGTAESRSVPRLSNCTWVFNQECSDCASSAGFPIDRLNALQ
jgi:hypothetical protein